MGVLALGMMLPLAASAQKSRYSSSGDVELQYPLVAHVTHAFLVPVMGAAEGAGSSELHVEAIIDGTKYELKTNASGMLHPGEFRCRELKINESKAGWYSRQYELLFDDGTHVMFKVVGESSN